MLLRDAGATVVKIEPDEGDASRREPGHRVWNRGKQSAVLPDGDPHPIWGFIPSLGSQWTERVLIGRAGNAAFLSYARPVDRQGIVSASGSALD
jgi:hypothetical protein